MTTERPKTEYKYQHVTDAAQTRQQRIAFLTWSIFHQSKEGKELLKLWFDEYIVHQPIILKQFEDTWGSHAIGIREGQNHFIRTIHNDAVNWHKQVEEQ